MKIELFNIPGQCDHCGAKTKHAFLLTYKRQKLYIGRVCLERILEVNTSGNPYKAIERIKLYISKQNKSELWSLLNEK